MNRFAASLVLLILVGCSDRDLVLAGAEQRESDRAGVERARAPFLTARTQVLSRSGSFADLPDRGELLAYPDRDTARRDGAYTWHKVGVSEAHALHAIAEGALRVVTPTGEVLDIQFDRHVEHPSGDWSWIGHLRGEPGAQTILTFGAEAVFGSIAQVGKRSLQLTSRDASAWLVETDPDKLRGIASAGANPRKQDHLAVPKHRGALADRPLLQPQSVQAAATAAAATTVDVLVGYSQGFAAAQGGASGSLTRLNHLVAVTNVAYANSRVDAQIRLVHAMQVSYVDNTTNETTLEQLTGYDVASQQLTTPNPAFNALRAAREQYGADLVVLMRQFRDPEQEGCGIAWLIGGGKSGIRPGDDQDYFGYSIVSDGQDRNEDDGNTYFCREESFAHELAHNMGSAHDRAAAQGDDGVLDDPDDYGAFAYSFGYKASAATGNFYTIMAYGDDGQTGFRVFSNPRITICGQRACGTVNDDNARSLAATMPVVATFRAAVVPPGAPPPHDFNGDGVSDILWRNLSTGANIIWRSASGSTTQAVTATATVWKVAGVGDFNGDARADILWRNTSTGANVIWRSGNSATAQAVAAVGNASTIVAGVDDFNGDGVSDILWRNPSTGTNVIWRSANSSTTQAVATTAAAWKVAGTGDFNGDGRGDILWRNTSTGANVIWRSGNSATSQGVAAVANTSTIVGGVGDFNGDGVSDILWRNPSTGTNVIWRSANSAAPQAVASSAAAWKAVGSGDYNGDGRADILWRNTGTGSNVVWRSGNSATAQGVTAVTNLAWMPMP